MFAIDYPTCAAAYVSTSLSMVLLIIALLCWALYAYMRSGKLFWPITFILTAGILLAYNTDAYRTPVEMLENIGVSPNAQSLCLLCAVMVLTCLIGARKMKKSNSHGYLKTKSQWFGGLLAWVLICDTAILTIYLSSTYDYTEDNMMADFHKQQLHVVQSIDMVNTAELLNDKTLFTDQEESMEVQLSKTNFPPIDELTADTTYQMSPPALILTYKTAEKPAPYVPRSIIQPLTIKETGDIPSIPSVTHKKAISQADYAELKRYITQLEKRRYIQKRSLDQRRQMLPLLKEIANGADINQQKQSLNRWTALHFSCAIGDENITRWLLEHGANQNLTNEDGKTPFRCIGPNNDREIKRLQSKFNNN